MELVINESMFYYEKIINDFKKGEFLSKEHLEKINDIFNPLTNSNYITTYKDKTKLLSGRNYKVYNEIIHVKGKDIKEEDYVYIIRALNLTYKGSKIIVINKDIVYIPDSYKVFKGEFLRSEVERIIKESRRKSLYNTLKYRNKIKYALTLFKLLFSKLEI